MINFIIFKEMFPTIAQSLWILDMNYIMNISYYTKTISKIENSVIVT